MAVYTTIKDNITKGKWDIIGDFFYIHRHRMKVAYCFQLPYKYFFVFNHWFHPDAWYRFGFSLFDFKKDDYDDEVFHWECCYSDEHKQQLGMWAYGSRRPIFWFIHHTKQLVKIRKKLRLFDMSEK